MGLLVAVTLQLAVGGVQCVLLAVGVIIGVLLVLAPDEKFDPVFAPFGVTVNFGGGFGCCFMGGGNQAHDGLSLGYGGNGTPVVFRGLGGGLSGEFDCELSQLAGATIADFLRVLRCIVVHDLGSGFGGPQVLPPYTVSLLYPLARLCRCGDIGERLNLDGFGEF